MILEDIHIVMHYTLQENIYRVANSAYTENRSYSSTFDILENIGIHVVPLDCVILENICIVHVVHYTCYMEVCTA